MTAPDSFFDTVVRPMFTGIETRRMRDVVRLMPERVRAYVDEQDRLPTPVIEPATPFEAELLLKQALTGGVNHG